MLNESKQKLDRIVEELHGVCQTEQRMMTAHSRNTIEQLAILRVATMILGDLRDGRL